MPDKTKQLGFMAIDQYGQVEYLPGEHPRKALLEKLSATHATKMYIDKRDDPFTSRHAGYIVLGRWFTLYRVFPFTKFPAAGGHA